MSFSNFTELAVLNAIGNATAFSVATPYVSLHTGDPGETGASEVAGAGYARILGSFGAAAAGQIANDAAVAYTNLPAGIYTHCGIWDALAGGNFVAGGALLTARTLSLGDDATFDIGALIITLD